MQLIATFHFLHVISDKDFLMPVEDVFSITGRGTVATGRIESGVINTGDSVEIIGFEEKLDFNHHRS